MKKFMVIAKVNGVDYLVRMMANSDYGAEHQILDLGICGRHEYGCEGAQAFSVEDMKTDTFIGMAIDCKTVSHDEIVKLIEENNKRIEESDRKEKELENTLEEIKLTKEKLHELEKRVELLSK